MQDIPMTYWEEVVKTWSSQKTVRGRYKINYSFFLLRRCDRLSEEIGPKGRENFFGPQVRKTGRFLLILVLEILIFQRKILIEEAK